MRVIAIVASIVAPETNHRNELRDWFQFTACTQRLAEKERENRRHQKKCASENGRWKKMGDCFHLIFLLQVALMSIRRGGTNLSHLRLSASQAI